jgi:cellulose synthase operon protein C
MPAPVKLKLEQDPGFLQTVASIQSSSGQERSALQTFDRIAQLYADQHSDPPADVQIQYGWLLLKAGDDRRLYSVVTQLASSQDLSVEQETAFHNLWASWSVSTAAAMMKAGNSRQAVLVLETAARAFSGNAEVYQALAGAYLRDGQAKRAVAVYELLDMKNATLGEYQGAVGAALLANDMKHAAPWLESALSHYKEDAAILRMAAQYEQARGDTRRAAAYYRAALQAMGPEPMENIISPAGQANPRNPGSPTQDLMRMLAPQRRVSQRSAPIDIPLSDPTEQNGWMANSSERGPTLGDFDANDMRSGLQTMGNAQSDFDSAAPEPLVEPTSLPLRNSRGRTNTNTVSDASSSFLSEASPKNSPYVIQSNGDSRRHLSNVQTLGSFDPTDTAENPEDISESATNSPGDFAPLQVSFSDTAQAERSDSAGKLQNAVQMLSPHATLAQSALPPTHSESYEEPQLPAQMLPAIPDIENKAVAVAQALPPLRGAFPAAVTKAAITPREEVETQLATIEGGSTPWFGNSTGIAYRNGQPGYERLSIYSAQIEESSLMGPDMRFTVIERPVLLDMGTATSGGTIQQGTLPVDSVPYTQSAAGIGGEVQVRTASFAASVGYTPYGFLVDNVIASFYLHPPASHFTLSFDRDAVKETQLSFAGLRDEGSVGPNYPGNIWGGVVTSGGELQINSDAGKSGWYIQGGGQHVTGQHVPSNNRIDGDAGAYWSAWQNPAYGSLTVGMNFFGMHYSRNLRYFTYGQGGYFSPGAYLLGGVPFTFEGHQGAKFHYRATASLGIQAFQEDSSPYFPLNPEIQAAKGNPYYPERTSVGGNYNFESEGAYAIADHWYVGGNLSFNNALDYASAKAGFFFRYTFRPQVSSESSGPSGLFPVQGWRPMQVP